MLPNQPPTPPTAEEMEISVFIIQPVHDITSLVPVLRGVHDGRRDGGFPVPARTKARALGLVTGKNNRTRVGRKAAAREAFPAQRFISRPLGKAAGGSVPLECSPALLLM